MDSAALPAVSCICNTYARPVMLEEAIESFLRQDYEGEKELIVLNDFAHQELLLDHPLVSVFNETRRYPTIGDKLNECISRARYDTLFLWDDDDICLPHRLSTSIKEMRKRRGAYFKPTHAFHMHYGKISGFSANVFFGQSCWTRELFLRAGRYPSMNSGQDQALEEKFRKIGAVKAAKLRLSDHFFVYRWDGTGSFHLSQFGKDRPGFPTGLDRIDEVVNRGIEKGEIETGTIRLTPRWRQDYTALVGEFNSRFKNIGKPQPELGPVVL